MSQDTNTEYNCHKIQPQLSISATAMIHDDMKDNLSKFSNNDNSNNLINIDTFNEEVNSESDDDENFVPFEYEALPQDENDTIQEESYDFTKVRPKVLQIRTSDQEKIPDDDLAVINSIMKNIKIPDAAIPEWAKSIPEEAWLPIVINDVKSDHDV